LRFVFEASRKITLVWLIWVIYWLRVNEYTLQAFAPLLFILYAEYDGQFDPVRPGGIAPLDRSDWLAGCGVLLPQGKVPCTHFIGGSIAPDMALLLSLSSNRTKITQ